MGPQALEDVCKCKFCMVTSGLSGASVTLVPPREPGRTTRSTTLLTGRGFDWNHVLSTKAIKTPAVSNFEHVPFSKIWHKLAILGLKVEVEALDNDPRMIKPKDPKDRPYWIATVVQFAGYKALIRYEGFEDNSKYDKWMNICTDFLPIGFCQKNGLELIPPYEMGPCPPGWEDWRFYLVENIVGGRTLLSNHKRIFKQDLECSLTVGSFYEVLDKTNVSRMILARVNKIIGRRVHVVYWNMDDLTPDSGFWCHEKSPGIHGLGWSRMTGHKILAPDNYEAPILSYDSIEQEIGQIGWRDRFDAGALVVGLRLEVLDPLNLSKICAAVVVKVLKFGYFMVQIDSFKTKRVNDQFCYHITSPLIFQCGFCSSNGIKLEPPYDSSDKKSFDWNVYLKEKNAKAVQIPRENISHGFEVGMKLEAVDVMAPGLVSVATVSRVVGRLIRIHFDGWNYTYDQWVDAKSVDIFPIGWCEAVGYKLEPPNAEDGEERDQN